MSVFALVKYLENALTATSIHLTRFPAATAAAEAVTGSSVLTSASMLQVTTGQASKASKLQQALDTITVVC